MGSGVSSRHSSQFDCPDRIIYLDKQSLVLFDITNNRRIKNIELDVRALCVSDFDLHRQDRESTRISWDENKIMVLGKLPSIPLNLRRLVYDADFKTELAEDIKIENENSFRSFVKNVIKGRTSNPILQRELMIKLSGDKMGDVVYLPEMKIRRLYDHVEIEAKEITQIKPKNAIVRVSHVCYDEYDDAIILCLEDEGIKYRFEVWKRMDSNWVFQRESLRIDFDKWTQSYRVSHLRSTRRYLLITLLEHHEMIEFANFNSIYVMDKQTFKFVCHLDGCHPAYRDERESWFRND